MDGQNQRKHILIVDDSPDDRNMYAHYLSLKGYQVSKACDGRDGLEKAVELRPHLILLDLWMPRMDGWEAMQRLKADERTRHIPVLVITGHSSMRPRECEGLLTKPCALDQLGAEIGGILDSRGVGRVSPVV